jgi:pantetheine-phosphate adenylyltransferase
LRRAACPGSFDPVTNGHVDIVRRAAALFDEVVVAVGVNPSKQRLFTAAERIEMLTEVAAPYPNVRVAGFDGLLTDFCRDQDVHALVKGVRAAGDLDYELQMAQMNAHLAGVETVFVPTRPEHSYVASSLVKEVARLGGDVSELVPPAIHARLTARLGATG